MVTAELVDGAVVSKRVLSELARHGFYPGYSAGEEVTGEEGSLLREAAQFGSRNMRSLFPDRIDYKIALQLLRGGDTLESVVGLYSRALMVNTDQVNQPIYPNQVRQRRRADSVGHHGWRRNERAAYHDRMADQELRLVPLDDSRFLLRVVDGHARNGRRRQGFSQDNGHEHRRAPHKTNEILEFYGISDGSERAGFLTSLLGATQHRSDLVRESHQLLQSYGIQGAYEDTTMYSKEIFAAAAQYIRVHGAGFTDAVAKRIGIDKLPEVNDLSPMQLHGRMILVPRTDIHALEARLRRLPTSNGHLSAEMENLGYKKTELRGMAVYRR